METLLKASISGDLILASHAINDGVRDFNEAMRNACEYGHIPIVKLLLEKDTRRSISYSTVRVTASHFGHTEIVKLLLNLGDDNHLYCLQVAAHYGHIDTVRLLLSNNSIYNYPLLRRHYNCVMESAALGGHIDIVLLSLENQADSYNQTMIYAIQSGSKEIVQLMLSKGADNYRDCLFHASKSNNLDIALLLLEKIHPDKFAYDLNMDNIIQYVGKDNEVLTLIRTFKEGKRKL